MRQLLGAIVAACMVAIGLFIGSAPAQATPHIFEDDAKVGVVDQPTNDTEQVCAPLSSGKIDLSDNPPYYDIVLDDPSMVITGYCAKAGSAKQGEGPETFSLPFLDTYRIIHSSGKELSHVSWLVSPRPITEPVATPITEPFEVPSGFDYCGTLSDKPYVPAYDASQPFTAVTTVNGNVTTVELIPSAWRYFPEGVTSKWVFTYTDVSCPIFITEIVIKPTVCNPQPDDTDQYYFALTGDKVFAVAKPGHILQQDLIVEWPNLFGQGECEITSPPVVIEKPVVTPPVDLSPSPIQEESPAVPVELDDLIVPASIAIPVETHVKAGNTDAVSSTIAVKALAKTGISPLVYWLIGLTAVLLIALGRHCIRSARAIK